MNRYYSETRYEKSAQSSVFHLLLHLFTMLKNALVALRRTRAYTAVVAIGAVALILLSLGVVGGVESGALPFFCMLPLAFAWPCAALLLHLSRK